MSTSAGDHPHDRELFTQIADREALAQIIALTYKMQPNSMLNPAVPLLMADAILAAGFARVPSAVTDWQSDETVSGIRNLAHERFMDEAHQYERGFTERFRLRWSFTQGELNALCDAVAAASRTEDTTRLDWLERAANWAPVEVDAFTGLQKPREDRVFLTTHDLDPTSGKERAHRLGQGSTLRAAIDAPRAAEGE